MADSDSNLENRMWRLEREILRLERIEARLEKIESNQVDRAWRVESMEYKMGELAKKVDELEKKPPVVVTGAMGDSTVRVIIYGLIAGVVALAGGQAINLTGLLK